MISHNFGRTFANMDEATGSAELQAILDRRGLNPHQLAAIVGTVSDSSIRNYLNGSTPKRSKLRAIAEALGPQDGGELLLAYGETAMAMDIADTKLEEVRTALRTPSRLRDEATDEPTRELIDRLEETVERLSELLREMREARGR